MIVTLPVAGFSKLRITPEKSVSLAGYFNDRKSAGILDDLYVRTAVFSDGRRRIAFIVLDLIGIDNRTCCKVKEAIHRKYRVPPYSVMVSATHTHTSPPTEDVFGAHADEDYKDFLCGKIIQSVGKALDNTGEVKGYFAMGVNKDLSYNRRFFMRDGKVVTNPGKKNPDIVRAEGPTDPDVAIIRFHDRRGAIRALFVNATNHADTIGGNFVSADWPGHMERHIISAINQQFPVFLFNGAAGNINHFIIDRIFNQTCYRESIRIGQGYGDTVLKRWDRVEQFELLPVISKVVMKKIPAREVPAGDLAAAKELIKTAKQVAIIKDMTAEDLARGDSVVKTIFAKKLVAFHKRSKEEYTVPLQGIRLGELAFCGLPGEPFVEIGLSIKKKSRFKHTCIVELANGSFGYIPLEEHFARGGYETYANVYNPLSRKAGFIFIDGSLSLLKDLLNE